MLKNSYQVIGIMSGTSLDGIDLAHVSLELLNGNWEYSFLTVDTVVYPEHWQQQLSMAINASPEQLVQLDEHYTLYLSEVINAFITNNNIQNLDAVCSHGHTILHQPDEGITLQIGNNFALANLINQKVVCDFRVADVALGGQGAPLVPIGDRLLFGDYDYCINLGGFANVSNESPNGRIAYDLCPLNVLLNRYAHTFGLAFDDEGKLARSGQVLQQLLSQLDGLPYYSLNPPKSLGMEWVLNDTLPILESQPYDPIDILCTLVEHMAKQIAKPLPIKAKVLITGGGAFNTFLLERISYYKSADFVVPAADLVNYKEALIFALLGVLKLRNEPNCLASVTGAKHDHCSGNIFEVE